MYLFCGQYDAERDNAEHEDWRMEVVRGQLNLEQNCSVLVSALREQNLPFFLSQSASHLGKVAEVLARLSP